ncbi:MAG: DUF892 family protein [Rhodospirillales bacterium]
MESYAIGRYGTLKDWSCKLGIPAAEDVIEQTLREANRTAEVLSRVVDDIASPDEAMAMAGDVPTRSGGARAWLN